MSISFTYIGGVVDGDCMPLLRVVDPVTCRKDLHLDFTMPLHKDWVWKTTNNGLCVSPYS